MMFNPDFLNLLQSVEPFLGPTGKTVTQLTGHFAELLSSQTGQKALQSFSAIKPKAQVSIMPADTDPAQLEGTNPFALFLILILLIFATQGPEPAGPPGDAGGNLRADGAESIPEKHGDGSPCLE